MKQLLLFVIGLILLPIACTTTKYIDREVPIETVKTEYINKLYRDSIYIHDSVDRYINGDTVYQFKYKYVYTYLNRTDTVLQTDTIEVPIEIKTVDIKEVNKLKWYQTIMMWIGALSLIILSFNIGRKLRF